MQDLLESVTVWLKAAWEKPLQTLPALLLLAGLILLVAPLTEAVKLPDRWGLAFLFLGTILILAAVYTGVQLLNSATQKRKQAKQAYDSAIGAGDLSQATVVLRTEAIRKLTEGDVATAIAAAQEIAEHGSQVPFEEGFQALAKQLVRRRNWSLKFAIVDALCQIVHPLGETKREK
jgi:hypothetical protein